MTKKLLLSALISITILVSSQSMSFLAEHEQTCSYSKTNFFQWRKLASSTRMWQSELTQEQRQQYESMIELKNSFAVSLSFLPTSYEPEKVEYWSSLSTIVTVFVIIACFPIGFILFYLFVRFVWKKCRGPEKIGQITRIYRNVSWVILIAGVLSVLSLFTIILVYSVSAHKSIVNSFNSSIDNIEKTKNMYEPLVALTKEIENIEPESAISQELWTSFKEGLDNYIQSSSSNTEDLLARESNRHTGTILIYVGYLVVIGWVFLCFFFRWQAVLMVLSILTLFAIPAVLIFEGYTAKFYFNYSDLCGSVNGAIYKQEFPVANQGLGHYINCLEKNTKSKLYTINYQWNQIKMKTENTNLKQNISTVLTENIEPLLYCDNVYNVVQKIEKDFCYKGMGWFNSLLELFTWSLILTWILSVGIDRLEILVWKKRTEIESMIENEEAVY